MIDLFIKHDGRTLGYAQFPDDAQDFAERLAGRPDGVMWEPMTGEMLVQGRPTGWKITRAHLHGGDHE